MENKVIKAAPLLSSQVEKMHSGRLLYIIDYLLYIKNKCYLFLSIPLLILLTSCAEKYVIEGNTSQFIQDGTVAYIKQFEPSANDVNFRSIDSCEILHGKFDMSGTVDSSMMVLLYMGSDNFPMILEPGRVSVSIANNVVKIEGTPLNDRLYAFLCQRDSLHLIYDDLPNRESLMYLDGYSQEEIMQELSAEELRLHAELDNIETRFVIDNFDNPLGITWFLRLCYEAQAWYGFPTTTPQIDEIYSQAPRQFKENKLVSAYMKQVEMSPLDNHDNDDENKIEN